MDANQKGLERTTKDDLVFPTDGAALLFALLIFGVAIFKLNQGFLADPDTYWHIATGRWMWAEHSFPRHDFFSYTAAGQPWVNGEWLAQIILALTYDWFGWRGLIVLCGLVVALTFVLLYKLLARELRATVALGAAAISFLFASIHFLARPHLLACPIIVVWTAHLARASAEHRRPSLWLLPLMVLWANLHGGFTLGLLLTGGFGTRGDHRCGGSRAPTRRHPMDTFRYRFAAGRLRYAIRLRRYLADVSRFQTRRGSAVYWRMAANEPLCGLRSGISVALSPGFGIDFRREDRDRSRPNDRRASSYESPACTRLADFCVGVALLGRAPLAAAVHFSSAFGRIRSRYLTDGFFDRCGQQLLSH